MKKEGVTVIKLLSCLFLTFPKNGVAYDEFSFQQYYQPFAHKDVSVSLENIKAGNNDAVHSFLDTDHLDNSLKYEVDHEDLLERFISGGIENSGSEFDRYNQNDDVNYGNDYNDQHHHEHRKDYDHHHYTDNVLKDHDHQINHDHQYHHEHQDQTDHGHHHKHQDHHDHHYKHHHEDHDNYNHPNGNDDDFYNYKDLSHHLYAYYDHHY